MSSKKQINKLEKLKKGILQEILSVQTMFPGSFNKVYGKCGKTNCWCYRKDKAGHPSKRITWSEKGVGKTKTIPEKDAEWIKSVTENYRNFRKKCREIQRLEEDIRKLLDDYRKDVVNKTRKLRQYL